MPESKFNLDEAVTKMARSFEPLTEACMAKIRIESSANCKTYMFEVSVLQVNGLLHEIMPSCIYPSECLVEIDISSAPKKPMVALNSW